MRTVIATSVALVLALALAATLWLHLPWEMVAALGLGLVCLGWLIVVLTLPWNLYFQARAVLFEMGRARERGIAVRPERELEAKRVETRMLRLSVGLHVLSAVLAAVATAASRGRWGYAFSGAYLLSGFLRPGVEYYRYLRRRLGALSLEVHFPRDDVKALAAEVAALRGQATTAEKAIDELRRRVESVHDGAAARDEKLEKRLTALARTFEDTLDRLTDNQQILGGLKALLRLIQQGGEPAQAHQGGSR